MPLCLPHSVFEQLTLPPQRPNRNRRSSPSWRKKSTRTTSCNCSSTTSGGSNSKYERLFSSVQLLGELGNDV